MKDKAAQQLGKRGGDKTASIYGRAFFQENQRKSVEARKKKRKKALKSM